MLSQLLLLPEVLGGILSHLSTPDLKSCALVTRSWSQEATRLLWHSIKFDLSELECRDTALASEKFARFINTLTLETQRAPYVRRLAIHIDEEIDHPEWITTSTEAEEMLLSIPWASVLRVLDHMRQLQYLDLQLPSFLSRPFLSSLCGALSGSIICAVRSRVYIESALIDYSTWASSITDLILNRTQGYPELPHLPHLRFIACDNIDVVSGFILSSPLQSICIDGGWVFEDKITKLVNAIAAQVNAGKPTLRNMVLSSFLSSLKCPTLEHLHLVLDSGEWFEPYSTTDYVATCLEATSSSMSQALPALKSLQLELYHDHFRPAPIQLKSTEHASTSLMTEAACRLSSWLQLKSHPPLLQSIQIYGMGVTNDDESAGCRIIAIEAKPPWIVPGELVESPSTDVWEVTDSVEDIFLPDYWIIHARGLQSPWIVSDPTALPVVADRNGAIRPHKEDLVLTEEIIRRYLSDFSWDFLL
ncbi:hypothetical protein DL93DRAFT_2160292 [Clavulina sp. PMI_390]|nr:hypothetical protein DL93DRAFT_2160292 [Clavulina sp. PMI_390]